MPLFEGRFDHILTVDGLRALDARPAWFGLGFIQIKLDDKLRMHFWHPELSADTPEEELHDHRYEFTSHVAVGSTTHDEYFYDVLDDDDICDHEMVLVSCKPGESTEPRPISRGRVRKGGSYTMVAGSHYTFPPSGFHRIRTERCVTILERGPVVSDMAKVIRPIGTPAICPFERKIPESELWGYIADLLEGVVPSDKVSNPGYHVNAIPKGVLGQSSKILEEVLELQDAELQGSKIMAQVELADLYGAIEAYVDRRYPGMTMEDLKTFSAITVRAFESGRRS